MGFLPPPPSLCNSHSLSLMLTPPSTLTTRAWERDRRATPWLLRDSAPPWKRAPNSVWSVDNLQPVMDTPQTWTPLALCTSSEETDIKCPSTTYTASNWMPTPPQNERNAASLARLLGTKTPRSRQTKRENE
jgi:hypothetical protein